MRSASAWKTSAQEVLLDAAPLRRRPRRLLVTAMSPSGQTFQLTKKASLVLQKGDLTKAKVDAIVNAANERMLGGGGVDGAIHKAAGSGLVDACREVPEVQPGVRCPTGEARITRGCNLPAKFVIHTVGPVYSSKGASEPLLYNAYKSSLDLANKERLKSIAFPAISCGVFGYPIPDAARVSLRACQEHAGNLEEVSFVLFGDETYNTYTAAAQEMLS